MRKNLSVKFGIGLVRQAIRIGLLDLVISSSKIPNSWYCYRSLNNGILISPEFIKEKYMKHQTRSILTGLVGLFALFSVNSYAQQQAVPDGFDDYAVYMATGTIPFSPHPNPEITGCGASIFCDGNYFYDEIMGMDAAAIANEEQRAKDYFASRFGIDVGDLVASGRATFSSFFLDPRGEYRLYTKANRKVSSEGWVVRDGGFALTFLDPNGVPLGGEFDGLGLVVPADSLLVWGSYNVQSTNPNGKNKEAIIYDYRSEMPMIANDWGELVVNCQLSITDFASNEKDGKAQGMGTVSLSSDFSGLVLNWRNVLTIGGLDLLQ